MEMIKVKLADRLAAKGLGTDESKLFIRDVTRTATGPLGLNMAAIRSKLHLLGWRDNCTDYGTIQLIQACYLDR